LDNVLQMDVAALYYVEKNKLVGRLDIQCSMIDADLAKAEHGGDVYMILPINEKLQGFTLVKIKNSGMKLFKYF